MKELYLEANISGQLTELYAQMESAFNQIAEALNFSCNSCPDNCCDSYFQHHTYVEWAFLWEGLRTLPSQESNAILQQAEKHVVQSEKMLARGDRPNLMCPLNTNGLCSLYSHRLMICRLHGVPATLTQPDGRKLRFPGCFRCQELISQKDEADREKHSLERADLYRRLADLEIELLSHNRNVEPKVKLSLAQMLVHGPPRLL